MRTIQVTWKGKTPLIMHSCQCIDPIHPINKKLKPYTSKRNKTDEDFQIISDLEWEAGAYWDDEIGLFIPFENVEATIINGAKETKNGKNVQKYCDVMDIQIPLDYGARLTKEELIADYRYRDKRPMSVQRNKVMRTRPYFKQWAITFNLRYNEKKIDFDVIRQAMEYAGNYVGLCDSRPKYGKFDVIEITELD